MLVRQLIGPQAGEKIEMPYAVVLGCLRQGTVRRLEDEIVASKPRVMAAAEIPPAKSAVPQVPRRKRGRPRKNR